MAYKAKVLSGASQKKFVESCIRIFFTQNYEQKNQGGDGKGMSVLVLLNIYKNSMKQ
jgi:hypothetical protein